ncbi:MAG: hypothetical protein V3R57_02235 [Candidatus Bathyarchaeia archaeon]
MSYCRKNGKDSDVYLIATGDRSDRSFWSCIGCELAFPRILGKMEIRWTELDTLQQALDHLIEHREAGHKVPKTALDRLRREIGE